MDTVDSMSPGTKRPRTSISPRPLIKSEPLDSSTVDAEQGRTPVLTDVSRDQNSTRGQVVCGHCRMRRASVCCMEEVCVVHAKRKWRMTTMLICSQCDKTIHDNPVMSDHLRTVLLIRGLNCSHDVSLVADDNPFSALEKEISGVLGSNITISTNVEDSNQEPEVVVSSNPKNPPANCSNQNNIDLGVIYNHSSIALHKTPDRKSLTWSRVENIHKRYTHVLQVHLTMHLTPTEMFRTANVPRQTLLDTVGIAELKIVDPKRYEEFMGSVCADGGSGRVALGDLERGCRGIIREHCRDRVRALRGTKLLPLNLSVYD